MSNGCNCRTAGCKYFNENFLGVSRSGFLAKVVVLIEREGKREGDREGWMELRIYRHCCKRTDTIIDKKV